MASLPIRQRRSSRRPGCSRGLALIELAIILPLLIILTFGIIEYGWLFTKAGEITNAARHGARIGVRPDFTTGEVQAAVADMMQAAGLADSGYTVTLTPANVQAMTPGQVLTVRITVPYSSITLTNIPLIPVPSQLAASVRMVKEGPPA